MTVGIDAVGLPAAPGGLSAAGSILRAAFFIDGFNLYHAVADLGEPHFKWLNLHSLAEKILRRGEHLEYVVWCTAITTTNFKKVLRHREYRKALEGIGVICRMGHFTDEPRRCAKCKEQYLHPTEKEGDVNLAISLISDAHLDKFDVAYLVTADSDQLATVKMFRERFPKKQIVSVAPPGRSHSKAIVDHSSDIRKITRQAIAESLFEGPTIIKGGTLDARRPEEYTPPGK